MYLPEKKLYVFGVLAALATVTIWAAFLIGTRFAVSGNLTVDEVLILRLIPAFLIMLPLTHSFMGYDWAYENLNFVAGYIILISGLLVSRIPTFSIKRKQFFIQSKLGFLVLFSLVSLSMINFLWATLNVLALIYLLTIPFSVIAWQSGSNRGSTQ